jgi:hypothetical protein
MEMRSINPTQLNALRHRYALNGMVLMPVIFVKVKSRYACFVKTARSGRTGIL